MSFAEAAQMLGVDAEKVRRLVVEDQAIAVVCVDGGGLRRPINLPGLLVGGAWRVDEGGRLCVATPRYEQGMRVDVTYEPPGVGELRIERTELERFKGTQRAEAASEAPQVTTGQTTTASELMSGDLPKGLDLDAIADLFDGISCSRLVWSERLRGASAKWLTSEPVVTCRVGRGKAPDGGARKTLRNPVAMADYLVRKKSVSLDRLNRAFKRADLGAWQRVWESYFDKMKDYMGDR